MTEPARHILMIEPTVFGYNQQTAASNSFQNTPKLTAQEVQKKALEEFKNAVALLRQTGIEVTVVKDRPNSTSPDSIFPNNWISTHETGELILYPMAAPNRRLERRSDITQQLVTLGKYHCIDLSAYESSASPKYLEGTGSLIFDSDNQCVYAAISPRTDKSLVKIVAEKLGYEAICFEAFGKSGEQIYHTNVMLSIGVSFAVIGWDTIAEKDRSAVQRALTRSQKEIIALTNEQVYDHFAGNMLQLVNNLGETVLALSQKAFAHLTEEQRKQLKKHNDHLLPIDIPTIEFVGGGSIRCMIAEIRIPSI